MVSNVDAAAGNVSSHVSYDAFGMILASSNTSITTRFGFTGREFDAETGLNFYRARYYDPSIGRFLSEDPLRHASLDFSLYRYVRNHPTLFTDSQGLVPDQVREALERGRELSDAMQTPGYRFPEFDEDTANLRKMLRKKIAEKVIDYGLEQAGIDATELIFGDLAPYVDFFLAGQDIRLGVMLCAAGPGGALIGLPFIVLGIADAYSALGKTGIFDPAPPPEPQNGPACGSLEVVDGFLLRRPCFNLPSLP
jgi:RHS repeat-associated protein